MPKKLPEDGRAPFMKFAFDGFTLAYLASFILVAIVRPDGDWLTARMATLSLVFFALATLGALLSYLVSPDSLGQLIYAPAWRRAGVAEPMFKTFWGWQTLLLLASTLVLGCAVTEISLTRLLELEAVTHAMRLFRELASPDWSILPRAILKIIESIYIAFMATMIATPFAFVLSFLTARNLMSGSRARLFVYMLLRVAFNFARSVEPVLWAILFAIWVSFGPFAGMLALTVHTIASQAKQFSEIIEGVEEGPIDGIRATGAGELQSIWFGIVPQVILPFISFTIFRWDTNLRMATILGFVGGGGIGAMLMEYQGQARWPQVGTVIFVIALVVWAMDAFSSHVRSAVK